MFSVSRITNWTSSDKQGSDLIELRLTWGEWRIWFFGELSEFLEDFWSFSWSSLGLLWDKYGLRFRIKLVFRMNLMIRMNLCPKWHMLPWLFCVFGPLSVCFWLRRRKKEDESASTRVAGTTAAATKSCRSSTLNLAHCWSLLCRMYDKHIQFYDNQVHLTAELTTECRPNWNRSPP